MRPTRRTLLAGLLAAPLLAGAGRSGAAGRKLVVVSAYGGWDTTYALDPKPGEAAFDSPPGEVRQYGEITALSAPERPSVDAFFAQASSLCALIRGISVESLSHPQCTRRILTGVPTSGKADVAALVASVRGSDRPMPYLISSPAAFAGPLAAQSVHAGVTNQLGALVDPPEPAPLAPADDEAILGWLRARAERAQSDAASDYRGSLERASALDQYAGIFEPRSGPPPFEAQAEQAVRALSSGLSWSAALDSGLDFDTHDGNDRQGPMHETLFGELLVLLDLLEATAGEQTGQSLLDETTVAVISEMTRTPRLTPSGGKDHWPYATMLLFGAGLRGGRTYGGTDAAGLATEPLEPAQVLAGILELAGVDPAGHFPGVEAYRAFLA